jgi:aldehyde:ferredoxin oxidoreductase
MRVRNLELPRQIREAYVGGTGCGAYFLSQNVRGAVEWNDLRNILAIFSGPLGGTRYPGSGTVSVVTKGPMTEMAGASQMNGFFGAYLRLCGYDGIVVTGRADRLVSLYIDEDRTELQDATALRGMDVIQTEDFLRKDLHARAGGFSYCAIGPAGENLVRFATIVGDRGHIVSKNGMGAVMGSKNLKAIAVKRGGRKVPVYDQARFASAIEANVRSANALWMDGVYKYGTAAAVSLFETLGVLPVKNYTTSVFPEHGKLNGEYMRAHYETKPKPCYMCRSPHVHTVTIKAGPYAGFKDEEPEYEGIAAWGPLIGQSSIEEAIVLNNLTDRLGLDVNEPGWVIAWAMECFERGLLTEQDTDGLKLRWGNVKAVQEMLMRISAREGFGGILAEGVKRASESVGGEAGKMAIYTLKGCAPRGHDHRARWREIVDTCFTNTSTIEATFAAHPPEIAPPEADRFSLEDVVTTNAKINGWRQFDDSLGTCRFCMGNPHDTLECLNALTGWDLDLEQAMRIGRRIVNLLRVFNIEHGLVPSMERPSERYGSVPVDGPAAGKNIMANWDEMQKRYYRLMGWDENTGRPLPETLRELGIEWAL